MSEYFIFGVMLYATGICFVVGLGVILYALIKNLFVKDKKKKQIAIIGVSSLITLVAYIALITLMLSKVK